MGVSVGAYRCLTVFFFVRSIENVCVAFAESPCMKSKSTASNILFFCAVFACFLFMSTSVVVDSVGLDMYAE